MSYDAIPKNCLVCHQEKELKLIKDWQSGGKNFSLFLCMHCQIQFWIPFNDSDRAPFEEASNNIILKPKIHREYHKEFLKICALGKNMKILDIGCGSGEFLFVLQQNSFEPWGVDFDSVAINTAKKTFNLKHMFSMSITAFFQKNDLPKFDIITCFETIMYLENPLEFLKNIKFFLKPRGKLFMSMPSRERMFPNLNSWDFPHVPYPNQLTRWNQESIKNIFLMGGFKVVTMKYMEQYKIILATINEQLKAKKLLENAFSSAGAKSNNFKISPNISPFLSLAKKYIFATIPAFFVWIFGIITRRKNGIIFVELEQ